jgi:starch synthase
MNQMYSLRYGTLPIVRATGGLDDSVANFDERALSGTGFKFWDLNPGALFDTIGWAVHSWYHSPRAITQLVQNAMAQRFTWNGSATKYDALYQRAVATRQVRQIAVDKPLAATV